MSLHAIIDDLRQQLARERKARKLADVLWEMGAADTSDLLDDEGWLLAAHFAECNPPRSADTKRRVAEILADRRALLERLSLPSPDPEQEQP